MTDSDRTLIAIVLDKSGSMTVVRDATISMFNEFIQEQRRQPGTADVALTLFDTQFDVRHVATPLADVAELDYATYQPSGMTALYDAVGVTIDRVGKRLATTPEEQRPGKVVFVIITDGYENSSREYPGDRVRGMIKRQEEEFSWVFTFLGANQDAWANPLGVARANTMSYDNTAQGVKMSGQMVTNSVSAYRAGPGGQSASMFAEEGETVDLRKKTKATEAETKEEA